MNGPTCETCKYYEGCKYAADEPCDEYCKGHVEEPE